MDRSDERLLIISNNVLSNTRNNGKTILSYFDCLPRERVFQLYFSSEMPMIPGYSYFQLSDKDVLKGWFSPKKRGRTCAAVSCDKNVCESTEVVSVPKKPFYRLLREALWYRHWKSAQLIKWLDEVKPTAVFFVGGDCAFAYEICKFVCKRYHTRMSLYITDDYVMPYEKDDKITKIRKSLLRKQIRKTLTVTDEFFTVSQPMARAYNEMFGRESALAVNMPESLKCEVEKREDNLISLLYAGSLYYGRAEVLGEVAKALGNYNANTDGKKALLNIYTNEVPDQATRAKFEVEGACRYSGSLNREELKLELNRSDILVFAESFDDEQIRKTRFSLSTKVPEYLSVGKPILAVGPTGIGSMDYLADCAMCINDLDTLAERLFALLNNTQMRKEVADVALQKYQCKHNKVVLQRDMTDKIFGNT